MDTAGIDVPPGHVSSLADKQSESPNSDKTLIAAQVVWANRRYLLKVFLIAAVVILLLSFLIPNRYTATLQLMPPDSGSAGLAMLLGGGGEGSTLGALASDFLGTKTTSDMFIGVLKSETVTDRIVEKFELQKVYRKKYRVEAREKLASNTDIDSDKKSGIIAIAVTDKDPQRAAAIGQAYADELDRAMWELSTSSARRERVFLESRLKEIKVDLDNAAKSLAGFSSKTGTLDLPTQGRAMLEAAADLQGQLVAAETELRGLEQIYAPENVRVRAARAQVAELRSQMNKLTGSNGAISDSDLPPIRKLPTLGVTYLDLYRDLRVQEAVFEILTKQYELAKVQEAKEVPSVKILDKPRVPEKKSFPPRGIITLVGSFLVLMAVSARIFLRESKTLAESGETWSNFLEEVSTSFKFRRRMRGNEFSD